MAVRLASQLEDSELAARLAAAPDVFAIHANVLICAVNQSSAEHEVAREWLKEALNGATLVSFDRDFARF